MGSNGNIKERWGWGSAGGGEAQVQQDDIFNNLNKFSEWVLFIEIFL